MRLIGIQILLLFLAGNARAQSDLRKANAHFQSYEFALAITEYQKVLENRAPSLAIAQNLAHAYRLNNNSREAETWFAKVITFPDHDPVNLYHYAEALRSNGKYAEAKTQYQAYAAQVPAEAALVQKRVAGVDLAQSWLANPAPVVVQPEVVLNSSNADFSPVIFDSGVVFASDRPGPRGGAPAGWTGRPYLQLYHAKKESGHTWAAPTPLEPVINNAYHNGPASAAKGTSILYFTRTFIRKEKQKGANTDPTSWTGANGPGNDLVNRLAIYSIEKRNGKWTSVRPFAFNKVASYSVGHPALSPDGKYLYLVSDMPGGQGQTDIYYCERRGGGTWSKPVNAGPVINTSGRESFPVVAADGTLYFSSDGHPGMGGLDLFSAKGEKAAWREVSNLKPPFNSPRDDFGMLWNDGSPTGYLSSNRDSDNGTDDIFAFKPDEKKPTAPNPEKPLILTVTTGETGADASIRLLAGTLIKIYSKAGAGDSLLARTDAAGRFSSPVNRDELYLVTASRPGFLVQSVNALPSQASGDTLAVRLLLTRENTKTPIVLANIYYDLDKADIRPEAAAELNKLVKLLRNNPALRIELGAHTDSREKPGYNQQLSQRRAQAVVTYLTNQGVSASRLTARGYGESRLVNHCRDGVACSEAEHQQNRRTEFRIR